MSSDDSHTANIIRGHKAALANPHVSDEAKAHSEQIIESLSGSSPKATKSSGGGGMDPHMVRVIAGHKATLTNPKTSEESKAHSRKFIAEMEGSTNEDESRQAEIHHNRVVGGFKAVLAREDTSDSAKEHAREMLKELGEEGY
ncbi:hypothetical protein BDY24DRAFT_399319 [Mrakia frigida]|uniref:Con-6 family protein n=1 Tax=Mrakia frigida TaxID=29902 RepID=UPI003FCC1D91